MEASEQNEPLTSPADVCASNSVAPEPERKSFVEEMQDHIEVMLKMSRQLPPKGMQDPETEGTVFQRFLLSLIQTVRHSKEEAWVNKGYDKLSRKEQILKFAEVFMVSRMYQEFFGGGAAMSDVAMQEFASIRAKTLDTEQTLKRLYEHVQRPQPGRQLQPLINFGNPVGGQPRVFGAAVGQFYREQAHLQFLNHSIRYGQIRNFITVQQRYELADEEKEENTDTGADAEVGGANSSKTAGQRGPQFADLAHQFKTLCFGYSLLQRTGVQLNVYNAYFFFPSEKAGRAKLHVTVTCFAIQVLSPIFLAVNQMDFLKTLGNGHASNLGIWPSVSVFVVIILFITINQEIFSKQVHNSLLVYRMRNVAWNSSRTWQGKINLFMDMYANIVNPCITAIVINLILFSSENVLDAILNALALNFITEVDEYVLKADLDDAQLVHEQKLDAKIAAFISGDTTMAVSYKLSEKAQEGQAARQVFNDDIAPQERMILPFLFMSFAVSFICLTVLVCI